MASGGDEIRTVNLDLGNAAELHMVALNAAHIVSAKLTGSVNSGQRRMELQLTNGSVISIQPVKRLPDGLTERAIAAAKQIQFTPAEKDGHKVSQYVTVSYNFNIY